MSVYKTAAEIPVVWQVGDLILDEIEVKAKLDEGHLGARDLVYHRGFKVELAVTSVDADLFGGQTPDVMRQVGKWVQLGLHPHVVTCHYVREMGGVPRIFTEYVESGSMPVADGSLADWISERTLYEGGHEVALGRILDVAIQVAWGLSYAHEKGVYHQNVTPKNVMLMAGESNSNPIAKLTDFGTPKAVTSDIYGWGLSVLQMFRGQNEWQEDVIAADVLADLVKNGSQCADTDMIPPMPAALADLLRDCAALASELADETAKKKAMGSVADQVIRIYEQEMGQPYASKQPQAITSCADNLNNRAVSLAEQGEMEEAMRLWQAAIDENQHHIEARYNLGVARWRRGELTDEKLLSELSKSYGCYPVHWLHKHLLAQVHLERWDPESAIKLLEEAYEIAPDEAQIQAALKLAHSDDYPTAHCLRTLYGHTKSINSVALSADGRLALSSSYDNALKVWDLADGRCLRHLLSGHTDYIRSVALAADGRLALSSSRDKTLKVWDLTTAHCLHTLEGHTSYVNSVVVKGHRALSGSWDHTLKVWDLASGCCVRTLEGHNKGINSVALSYDGHLALSASYDRTLKLWNMKDGRCLRTLKGHRSSVESVAFSASGRLALSGSSDRTLKLWDLTDGRCLRTFEGHTDQVNSVAFVADDGWGVSSSLDKTIKVWNLASGRCLCTLEKHTSWVALAANGRRVLSGSSNSLKLWALPNESIADRGWQLASLWSVSSRVKAQQANVVLRRENQEHLKNRRLVTALTMLQQARKDPLWISADANLEAWCSLYPISRKKRLQAAWPMYTLEGHTEPVNHVAISFDGRLALSGSNDTTVKVWELADRRLLNTLKGHTDEVISVAFAPDGRLALSGSKDTTVKVWDLASGDCVRTLRGHTDRINSVAFAECADSCWVLSGSWDSTFKVWDLASGKCLRTITGLKREVGPMILEPSGRQALCAADGKLKIWKLALQRCLRTLKVHSFISSLVVAADGGWALSSSWDKTLKMWDLKTGRCLRTLEGHTLYVASVALETSERWALSGSGDKTLKMWDLATGESLRTLEGHTSYINSVALSGDGRWAITGLWDGTIKVWALDWELETFDEADWDEGARVYLVNFLTRHTPFAGQFPPDREPTTKERRRAFTRRGKPTWSEEDFQRLIRQLQYAGYGWLRPEGVRAELTQMAKTWKKPPKL